MHTGKWMIACIAAIGLLSAGVVHAASTLEVWVPWGGDRIPRFEAIGRAFTQSEPGINVRFTTAANNLESNEKFFVAVASGAPPDVIFVDGPQVAPWAHAGALVPLDGYIRQAGLSERDFFVPAWRQLIYRGRIWALPAQTNPMLGFFWNKTIFAEVGLPNAAPATIPELDAYNRRIMRSTEDGRLERFGLIPWAVYGYANSLFNWGWIFGGRFFDEERQEFTVNDPRNVAALDWWKEYVDRYGLATINTLYQGINVHPFYAGRLGMAQLIPTLSIKEMAMLGTTVEYGLTPYQPYPEGGVEGVAWDGGWTVAIPHGAREEAAAWKFIRWYAADPVGTTIVYDQIGDLPGYRHSLIYQEFERDPIQRVFLRILELARYYRPVTIVADRMMGELDRAAAAVLQGEKTPSQALAEADRLLQTALEEALREASE